MNYRLRVLHILIVSSCAWWSATLTIGPLKADNDRVPNDRAATIARLDEEASQEFEKYKDRLAQSYVSQLHAKDMQIRTRGLELLIGLGLEAEKGVPIFLDVLNDLPTTYDENVLEQLAIETLASYKSRAKVATPKLIEILGSDHYELFVREGAARALGIIAPRDKEVTHALASAVDAGTCAEAAARVLGQMGPIAEDSIPTLTKALRFRNYTDIQYAAYVALGRIAADEQDVDVAGQIKRLEHPDKITVTESSAAFLSLQKLAKGATAAIPVLTQILEQRPESYFRAAAIETLSKIHTISDAGAVRMLAKGMSEDDPLIATWSEHALSDMLPEGPAIDALSEALLQPRLSIRMAAAAALTNVGPAARPAAQALVTALRHCNNRTGWPLIDAYCRALWAIGHGADFAAPTFVDLLDPQSTVLSGRDEASKRIIQTDLFAGLASVGMPADQQGRARVLSYVLKGLGSNYAPIFAAAARAAGELGGEAGPAVPHLLKALSPDFRTPVMDTFFDTVTPHLNSDGNTNHDLHGDLTSARLEAIRAVAKIGPPAKAAVPLLTQLASLDESQFILADTKEAKIALQSIRISLTPIMAEASATPIALNKVVPRLVFTSIQDEVVDTNDWSGKLRLFVFVDTKCPCVRAYKERMIEMEKKYSAQGLQLVYVFAQPDEDKSQVKGFAVRQKISWTVVCDEGQKLTKLFNAQSTSECFLLDRQGYLRYHGRIDDNIYKPDAVTQHNLEDAIKSVLSNQPVAHPEVQAVACMIRRIS
jgi:hypothetical protein